MLKESPYEMPSMASPRSNNPIGLFGIDIVNKISLVHDRGISDVTLKHIDRMSEVDVDA